MIWHEKALFAKAPQPTPASLGGTHRGPISQTAEISLLGAAFFKGKLGSENRPQRQCGLAQDPSACLVLTNSSAPHRAKEGLGSLWLRGHCCLAGGLGSWKPTPSVFSFAEKADLA